MVEQARILFDKVVATVVRNYKVQRNQFFINEISVAVKNIYNDPNLFKYIMETYYADNRNPFTNAYSQFMNSLKDTPLEQLFYEISRDILYRLLQEKNTNNKYIVF